MTMLPASVLYQISESDLEKLIAKAEQKGFELGQKKPIEKPMNSVEAARYLGINPKTLSRKFCNGDLPSSLRHVVGGSVLFFASELEEYIKKS